MIRDPILREEAASYQALRVRITGTYALESDFHDPAVIGSSPVQNNCANDVIIYGESITLLEVD